MKENQIKKFFLKVSLFFFCMTSLICLSCKSLPQTAAEGDLPGLVIDENNQPLENFVLKLEKLGQEEKEVISNERGLFIVSDMSFGKWKLYGVKEGYSVYREEDFMFLDKSKILCIQVNSADLILDKVEKQIIAENPSEAESLLSEIYLARSKVLKELVSRYRNLIMKIKVS